MKAVASDLIAVSIFDFVFVFGFRGTFIVLLACK